MCHENSENSDGCPYLLRICLLNGTNVGECIAESNPFNLLDLEQGAFRFTNKGVQVEILTMLKLVSLESLAGNDFSERGKQAEAHCERNLNRHL